MLFNDVLITLGIYALSGREVTTATVAAMLTVLGYSIYDTIIVFDRVRENMPLMPRASFATIANVSLWETIRRSLATSFITLLPIALAVPLRRRDAEGLRVRAPRRHRASARISSIFIAAPLLDDAEGARARVRAPDGASEVDGARRAVAEAHGAGSRRRSRPSRAGAAADAVAPSRAGLAGRRAAGAATARSRSRRRSASGAASGGGRGRMARAR